MGDGVVRIPFKPHKGQKEIMENLKRFMVLVCHRRFGKTVLSINLLIRDAVRTKRHDWRGGYIAPFYKQAKAAAWDYLKHYAGVVPGVKFHEGELSADFPNGSRIKLLGADNPDSLRGLYFDGVVLDETAQMARDTFGNVIRPALADRKGWALFIGTPSGRNLFYDLWETAQKSKDWKAMMFRAGETGVLDSEELAAAKQEMTPEQYAQEFECSFTAAISGAYYGALMEKAEAAGRVARVPADPLMRVHTVWDLGMRDMTAIWFFQKSPSEEVRIVDYYEKGGEGLQHYVRVLDQKRSANGYVYGSHFAPHDIRVRELGTGKSRLETAKSMGLRFAITPNLPVSEGINAVRSILPRCWFDVDKCSRGIEALKFYRTEFSRKLNTYGDKPLHDWSSHAADAFRYLALVEKKVKTGSSHEMSSLDLPTTYGSPYGIEA